MKPFQPNEKPEETIRYSATGMQVVHHGSPEFWEYNKPKASKPVLQPLHQFQAGVAPVPEPPTEPVEPNERLEKALREDLASRGISSTAKPKRKTRTRKPKTKPTEND